MDDVKKSAKKVLDDTEQDFSDLNSKVSKNKSKVMLWLVMAVVLLGALGAAGYFYKKYQDVKSDPKSAITEKNKAETQRVLDKLKANLLIGEKDAPTVARVEEPDTLKKSNAEFYKDIVKGDYLVIFPKRAVIFRESNEQIINIAPIINTADLKAKEGTTPAATTPKK